MNKLLITGKLCKDIELKFSQGTGNATLKNTVATRRKFKDKNTGNYGSDFIPFTAFGASAEFVAEHFTKGQDISIEAHMQSGSYEKDGVKKYTLEAIVENVEFLGSKGTGNNSNQAPQDVFGGGDYQEDITPIDNDSSMPF